MTGLTTSLWATIAVEAKRSVSLLTNLLQLPVDEVFGILSVATADCKDPLRSSRLNDYAHALRRARPRDPTPVGHARIALKPGLASATAWKGEAHDARISLEAWLGKAIMAAPDGFVPWEAAAADEGRSLSEWALIQAARRRRSARTPAQIAGC